MKHLFFFLSILYASGVQAKNTSSPASATLTGKHTALSFIENKGQVTDQNHKPRNDIQFSVAAAPGLNIFIGSGAIHYQFSKCNNPTAVETQDFASLPHAGKTQKFQKQQLPKEQSHPDSYRDLIPNSQFQSFTMYRMDVTLAGANPNAQVITEEQQGYYENYFTENTGPKGTTACAYNKITYKDIYPHIDWVLYISNGQLKHEFVVNEGGNVADIKLKYGGTTGLKLNGDGSLTATTPQGVITEQAPTSYQQNGTTMKSCFRLNGAVLSYQTGSYSEKIIIDPGLTWATYYGGAGYDFGQAVATDDTGNMYITGYTTSLVRIATSGAYLGTYAGGAYDAFLSKFNSADTLLWATYYGGVGNDAGQSVATDGVGNAYITGYTSSEAGIATPGAYQVTCSGLYDAFLAKFSSTGFIQWATYYGGSGNDQGEGIAIDGAGNIAVTGKTLSTSGIATPGAYHTAYGGGGSDAFLARFSSTGIVQWGTYYGGEGDELGQSLATDGSGNLYITAYTSSISGIATPGAYHTTFSGGTYDAFLAKFSGAGAIQWATYLGGSGDDYGLGVATDGPGNVFVAGYTNSMTGVATPGAYQTVYGGGNDAFLAKFNGSGAIQWATYFGGSGDDIADGVATAASGNVFITGYTSSLSGIATSTAYQAAMGGGADAMLSKFNGAGVIQWATYFGGSGWDEGWGVAILADTAYITGYTNSPLGMATHGSHEDTIGGGQDAFLAKFNVCSLPDIGLLTGSSWVCADTSIELTDTTSGGVWSASNGNGLVSGGVITGITSGMDTIVYSVTNSCGTVLTTYVVTVNPIPDAGVISGMSSVCVGSNIVLTDTAIGGVWSDVNGNAAVSGDTVLGIYEGADTIKYTVIGGCDTVIATYVVTVNPLPDAGIIVGLGFICIDSAIILSDAVSGGLWSSGDTGIATVAAGMVSGIAAGTDTIKYSVSNVWCLATAQRTIFVTDQCTDGINSILPPARDITIYPNPATNSLTISVAEKITSITVSNLLGQTVQRQTCNADLVQVDVAGLPTGVYFVKINGVEVRKFVKE